MAEHTGNAFSRPESSQPVPSEETRDRHGHMVALGCQRFQARLGSGLPVAVHEDVSIMAQEADGHAAGMQVDTTIQRMLVGVESQRVSSVASLIS
jgi:hypothetical protein